MPAPADFIPQIQPWIDHEEGAQLQRVIQSTFVTEAELTKEFEDMTRRLTGATHAIAMANGTVALYCILKALGIGPGHEVIVPDLTFIATANAVLMAGATPVLCDIRADTFSIDADRVVPLITARTKAILPVHLYGQSADMERIMTVAQAHGLHVVEDAAQGVGVRFNGSHVGTFGAAGILSYYGNKTITCGEGGMVLTNSDDLARTCFRLKNHGRDRKGVFVHEHVGYNFSFTEMQAAIGIAQMGKLERIIQRKKAIFDRYSRELSGLSRLRPVAVDPRCAPVFWFTSILTDDRQALGDFLLQMGIQTRLFFYPLHRQPCYQGLLNLDGSFAVADRIYAQGLSLPSSAQLTDSQQTRVIEAIRGFYADRR